MARELYEQMFEHALDYLKGWPRETALDFNAKPSSSMLKTNLYGGCVVHLDANGEFMPGAQGKQMPIFLHQREDDFDVGNPGGNNWYPIAPNGEMSGLVAVGAYELESTEFEQDDAVVYAPNDILKSPTESQVTSGSENDAGKLYKRKGWTGGGDGALTLYTDAVCGVVSREQHQNAHGQQVISFWPVYCPSASA